VFQNPKGSSYVESHPNVAQDATLGWGTLAFGSVTRAARWQQRLSRG